MEIRTEKDLEAALRLKKLARRTQLLAKAQGDWRSKGWLVFNLLSMGWFVIWRQGDSGKPFSPPFVIFIVAFFGLERYFSTRIDALVELLEDEGVLKPEREPAE